ncbi:hypothetical protein B0T21DRAFT_202186 [Apiosordaria backusii]|uniref:Uncharacterized protein n=1 Tax=Apiosordaria backusii TaxID=314023 RepID=A0AA40EC44_9PEZI|nr:hypothetical protein B0T21DRAFT_202186 [Apiosordaria backusii]
MCPYEDRAAQHDGSQCCRCAHASPTWHYPAGSTTQGTSMATASVPFATPQKIHPSKSPNFSVFHAHHQPRMLLHYQVVVLQLGQHRQQQNTHGKVLHTICLPISTSIGTRMRPKRGQMGAAYDFRSRALWLSPSPCSMVSMVATRTVKDVHSRISRQLYLGSPCHLCMAKPLFVYPHQAFSFDGGCGLGKLSPCVTPKANSTNGPIFETGSVRCVNPSARPLLIIRPLCCGTSPVGVSCLFGPGCRKTFGEVLSPHLRLPAWSATHGHLNGNDVGDIHAHVAQPLRVRVSSRFSKHASMRRVSGRETRRRALSFQEDAD